MAQSATEFVERTDAGQALPGQARISGGHLVTKAFKAEGVETVFTLRGGHIIDIYDGCGRGRPGDRRPPRAGRMKQKIYM